MKKNNFFNWRFFVIIITIFFISFAIVWKLFDIQVTDKEFLENETTADDSFLAEVINSWESAANLFKNIGINVSIIRIGLVLSIKAGVLKQTIMPMNFGFGIVFGSGEQWQSWIHSDDLVAMFVYILESKKEGVYNAVAPNPVRQSELTKTIGHVIKKPIFLPNVPEFMLKLMLGGMSAVVLESQRVCSKKIQSIG